MPHCAALEAAPGVSSASLKPLGCRPFVLGSRQAASC
jgi:hypothetical protein